MFNEECRVLNAGSIVFLPGSGGASGQLVAEVKPSRRTSSTAGGGAERHSIKLSEMSLSDYTDRIKDDDTVGRTPIVKKKKQPLVEDIDEEEEDDEEDDEDEDEDEEDEDDEECDNCVTRTKFGNYVYKFGYKPLARPLKFIYYSVIENIKLLKLLKFTIFAFCNFILSFFYEAPFYFINSFMIENGSSSNQAGTVTVAVGIVSVFSSSKI